MFKLTITSLMSAMYAMNEDKHSHYISLLGPKEHCLKKGTTHLRVDFDDVEKDSGGGWVVPTREHVDAILAHTKDLTDTDDLLVHCMAGISRSTAAAIGICCQHGMSPADALAHVRAIREPTLKKGYMVLPNRLIIRHFDDALGLNGELAKVVDAYYGSLPLIGVTTLPNRGGWNSTDD